MIVRRSTMDDYAWISKEVSDFVNTINTVEVQMPSTEVTLSAYTDLLCNHVSLVAEEKGELRGFMAGLYCAHPCNDKVMMLREWIWWVPERFRGGRAGYMLLKTFVDIGKATDGVSKVTVTLQNDTKVGYAIMSRLGFRLAESVFVTEV